MRNYLYANALYSRRYSYTKTRYRNVWEGAEIYLSVDFLRKFAREVLQVCKKFGKFAKSCMESIKLSRLQFSLACGMPNNQLAVYIGEKHRKVVLDPEGLVDMANEKNKLFYAKRRSKKYGMPIEDVLSGSTPKEPPRPPTRTRPKIKKDAATHTDAKQPRRDTTHGDSDTTRHTKRAGVPPLYVPEVSPRSTADADPEDTEDYSVIPELEISERKLKHFRAIKEEHLAEKERLDLLKKQGDLLPSETVEPLVFKYKQHLLTQMKVAGDKLLRGIAHKYQMTPEDLAEYKGLIVKSLNDAVVDADESFLSELDMHLEEFSNNRRRGER